MSKLAAPRAWVAAVWRYLKGEDANMKRARSIDEVLERLQEQVDFHAEREGRSLGREWQRHGILRP